MKKLILLSLVTMFLASSLDVEAKNKYQPLVEQEGISFFFKWKPSKPMKQDSPIVLIIKIKNNNEKPAQVKFTVDYYWETVITASSDEQSFCVKAKKSLIGRIERLGFDKSEYTNDQIFSDDFIMELSGIKIVETEKCK